jgi:hypothetical protein
VLNGVGAIDSIAFPFPIRERRPPPPRPVTPERKPWRRPQRRDFLIPGSARVSLRAVGSTEPEAGAGFGVSPKRPFFSPALTLQPLNPSTSECESGLSAAVLDSRSWMLDFFLIERWELDVERLLAKAFGVGRWMFSV